jgi:hypothetical protein
MTTARTTATSATAPARVPADKIGNGHANGHAGATNGHANGAAGNPPAPPLTPSADGAAKPGQDARTGKFLPGNKLGRGNPHYRRLAASRTAFLEAVGPEQVKELAAKLQRMALAGSLEAAKLVLAYAIGKPGAAADPDRADMDEWQLLDAWPTLAQVMRALLDGTEAAEAVGFVGQALTGATHKPVLDRLQARSFQIARDATAEQRKRSGRKE